MASVNVAVPEELLDLLKQSQLGARPLAEQIRFALAAHLLQEGVISAGRAAEIAGEPRAVFESLLGAMGISPVRHDSASYDAERRALDAAQHSA